MRARWCASLHVCEANASYELCECFIEVVRLLLHIDEVDVSLKNIRVVILTSKFKPCLMTRLFSFLETYSATAA